MDSDENPFQQIQCSSLFACVRTKYIHHNLSLELKGFYLNITGYTFSRGLLKSLLVTFLPTYYVAQGESLWFAAYTLSILQLSGAIGSFFAGSVSDKIGRRRTLIIISLIILFLLISFYLAFGDLSGYQGE